MYSTSPANIVLSRTIDLPSEIIDQIFDRLKPIDLMATQYVSKLFNEMTRFSIEKNTHPEKDTKLQISKIRVLAIRDLIELGQFSLAAAKVKYFNLKNIISTLGERFQNSPSYQVYFAVAALSDNPAQALSYLSTSRAMPKPDLKDFFGLKTLTEGQIPKPDLKDYVWLKKQDQSILAKIVEIIQQTPEQSDQKTALGALSILLQLKIIPTPPFNEIASLNPYFSSLPQFEKEMLSIVYPAVLSYLVSDYALSVKKSYVFRMDYNILTGIIYDAITCFNSEKIYKKAGFPEYQIQTYINYSTCLARALKWQYKNSINLLQINPSKNITEIQELFIKFYNSLQNDVANDTYTKNIKTEIDNGFLSYYLELSDEKFRIEILSRESRMTKFMSKLSHPSFVKTFSLNPENKILHSQLEDLFFQRLYHSLMDENHSLYGQENKLLKSEGFIVVDDILKFPKPVLQNYFTAIDEFMGGLGFHNLINKLKNNIFNFETFE